jgi:2,5-diketo-D-gluconate reductase B
MVEAIPRFGLGTFRLDAEKTVAAVKSAIGLGYRHIDTAAYYQNEAAVGRGVRESGVPRDEIWITTKVWWESLAHDKLIAAVKDSHARLDCGPIDLMLVHWPSPDKAVPIAETLAALEEARTLGLIRRFGVSNFTEPLLAQAVAAPHGKAVVVNQIEVSPFLANRKLVEASQKLGVDVTAYMPLGEGRAHTDETLKAIGARHGATAAQITFAWLLSRGLVVISASTNPAHQAANLAAQHIRLDADDIARIDALDEGKRNANPAFGPTW